MTISTAGLCAEPALLKLDLYCRGLRLDDSCLIDEDGGREILRPPVLASAWGSSSSCPEGDRHPEVRELAAVLAELRSELEDHTAKEERVLFPAVVALEGSVGGEASPTRLPLEGPIQMMEAEHEAAGRALDRLRALSGDFRPPAGACPTFRGLYQGLAELESDTHRHVHLENHVLFPRAIELQEGGSELSVRAHDREPRPTRLPCGLGSGALAPGGCGNSIE